MSYILDALRKADAQRQRSRLPGLQAQATAPLAATGAQRWWRSPIAWAVGSGLLAMGVVMAWREMQPVPPVPLPTPASTAVQEPMPVARPAEVQATAPPVAATSIQPAPPPRTDTEPAPRAARSRVEAPQRAPVQAAAPTPSVPAAPPAVAPAAPSTAVAASTETAVPPPGAPKLTITGGVYSTNAAQRLLIVGGQVFNEGSEVAPGVVLEQVRPNQALLNFQGQRYTVRY